MWIFGGNGLGGMDASKNEEKAEHPHADVIVLISTFIVPEAMEQSFLTWWRMMRPIIAAQPGFISARLHRSLDGRESYRYVNIAEWRGAPIYRDALVKLWSSGPPPVPGVEWRPHLYEIVEAT